jgi:hypothetical protein
MKEGKEFLEVLGPWLRGPVAFRSAARQTSWWHGVVRESCSPPVAGEQTAPPPTH